MFEVLELIPDHQFDLIENQGSTIRHLFKVKPSTLLLLQGIQFTKDGMKLSR